jgi:two-component system chemotaxis sensor kinase CheA
MNMAQLLQTFIAECGELLEEMEASLLKVEHGGATPETINAIFRAAHTIKGSGGLFGLDPLVQFTHVAESVLDRVRNGKLDASPELVALLLICTDHIRLLVDAVAAGNLSADSEIVRNGEPLLDQLRVFLPDAAAIPGPVTLSKPQESTDNRDGNEDVWNIWVQFGPDVLRGGTSIVSLVRCLEDLGTIMDLSTHHDEIPDLASMDPETCYLGFEITLSSRASLSAIEEVFEFVRDECDLRIHPSKRVISEQLRMIESLPDLDERIGEILIKAGVLTAPQLQAALALQASSQDKQPLGTVLIEKAAVDPQVIEAVVAKQKRIKNKKAPKEKKAPEPEPVKVSDTRSIRVDADKLDYMINLVGELITAAAGANLSARRGSLASIQESTSSLIALVEEVRESALQLRMVKIGATFARFQRVVHDVSKEIGKEIVLAVSGEDAELDKTVVEKITDPLTHLVRNSMDHGIEPADVRAARGKPARGTVKLNAFHDAGNIVIEVSDDGGGLNREKILKKALERGLIDGSHTLSDSDIFNLIFEPGFSTAEKVTNLSGRGVGMDVVKRNITALRGTVNIRSEEGVGTTVSIRLPLTLAIINGFLVGVGNSVFVVPLDTIEECVRLTVDADRGYLNLRGQVLPLIRLRDALEVEGDDHSRRESVVVVRFGDQKAGLVVDRLLGEFQTVIKPLGHMFRDLRCVAGSTILGSGEVALILDVAALLDNARQTEATQQSAIYSAA